MILLLPVAVLAGLIAGVSPCILPVLPVVLVSWSIPGTDGAAPHYGRRRAVAVVLGIIVSFTAATLAGSAALSALHLSQNFLHYVGMGAIALLGLALLIPPLESMLERPFRRFSRDAPSGRRSAFLFGLGLGLVFVPCAGPVLSAVVGLGAGHQTLFSVLITVCFSLGLAAPLMAIALAGDRLIERNRALRQRSKRLRPVAGAILILMAVAIQFGLLNNLQKDLPGYTSSLQRSIEGNSIVRSWLNEISNSNASKALKNCLPDSSTLTDCGPAPEFADIAKWLNTPHGQPVSISQLRGKVVLVDFWTYSCINCQRELPHVEAWYQRYHRDGLVVVGVHSPEFAFEHVVSNVQNATRSFGLTFPVAIDNDLSTFNAYANNYWPAEYLIDSTGHVRHYVPGEVDYAGTENFIRSLLVAANPAVKLPPPTSVADLTPNESQLSPETYLGYKYTNNSGAVGTPIVRDNPAPYTMVTTLEPPNYTLGGVWTVNAEKIHAGREATLNLGFVATKIYLVMGGTGTVTVNVNGTIHVVHVSGYPKLYTLENYSTEQSGTLQLTFTKGIDAYDFTFG